jgi:hypothetical protein
VLRYADFTTKVRQRCLPNHISDGHRIYSVALKLFDELYQPSLFVRLLGVSVSSLARNIRQLGLAENERADSLFSAADAANDRFGEFSVARSRLMEPQTNIAELRTQTAPVSNLKPQTSGRTHDPESKNKNPKSQTPRVISPSWRPQRPKDAGHNPYSFPFDESGIVSQAPQTPLVRD